MFKLVVLSALIACGTAAPSLHHTPDQYAYAGPVATYAAAAPVLFREYQHLPIVQVGESSAAHHSASVVHSGAALATPIIEETREAQYFDGFHGAPVLKEVSASAHDIVHLRPEVHEVSLAKVGEFVEHVPSSVSHHSSSVVHSSAAVATPVISPATKTIVAAPVFHAAPVLNEVHAASHDFVAAPVLHAAPVLKEVHGASHDIVEIRPEIHHASLAKVGEVVEHVPTSVSHHSSSIVHSSAAVATPIIAPATKTVVSTAPIYRAAPLLKTVHAPATYAVHQAPLYVPYEAYQHGPAYYHSEPLLRSW